MPERLSKELYRAAKDVQYGAVTVYAQIRNGSVDFYRITTEKTVKNEMVETERPI